MEDRYHHIYSPTVQPDLTHKRGARSVRYTETGQAQWLD